MEKKSTHIFRKEKGQIVVEGEVNLMMLTEIKFLMVIGLLCVAVQIKKLPFCDGSQFEDELLE